MFFEGSRYQQVEDQVVRDEDGREVHVRRARPLVEVEGVFEYVVREGDRLDLLAHRFYRSARKWWLICDANAGALHPEELMVPGTVLRIPPDRNP